jgi:hypothetical protein
MTATLATATPAGMTAADIHDAMARVAALLALTLADDDGVDASAALSTSLIGVSDFNRTHAARQPISLAAAPPVWVTHALT